MKASKNKSLLERFVKEERASAKIVEYSIILPICLFILGLLFLAGFYLNQRAVLDAAVNRGVILAQKLYCDPNAETLMDLGIQDGAPRVGVKINAEALKSGKLKSEPYRYLKFKSKFDEIYTSIEKKIRNSVYATQLVQNDSRLSDLKVEMPKKFKGFMLYKMTVTVRQEFNNPFVPMLLGKKAGTWFSIESSATASVMNVTELIRTTDMTNDVVKRFSGKDTGQWVRQLMEKLDMFLSKVGEGSKKDKA